MLRSIRNIFLVRFCAFHRNISTCMYCCFEVFVVDSFARLSHSSHFAFAAHETCTVHAHTYTHAQANARVHNTLFHFISHAKRCRVLILLTHLRLITIVDSIFFLLSFIVASLSIFIFIMHFRTVNVCVRAQMYFYYVYVCVRVWVHDFFSSFNFCFLAHLCRLPFADSLGEGKNLHYF